MYVNVIMRFRPVIHVVLVLFFCLKKKRKILEKNTFLTKKKYKRTFLVLPKKNDFCPPLV